MSKVIADVARAMAHIYYLSETIGPRPSGSEYDQRARSYVREVLENAGYSTREQVVPFSTHPRFEVLYSLSGIIMVVVSIYLQVIPVAAVLLPAWFILLPSIQQVLIELRNTNQETKNLVASFSENEATQRVVLCAHLDSGRAAPFTDKRMIWLYSKTAYIVQRIAYLVGITGLCIVAGIDFPEFFHLLVSFIGGVVGAWLFAIEWIYQIPRPTFSHGANDNASGVGILLSLAEWYAAHPIKKLKVEFLFTGAEETGLHGSKAYIRQLDSPQNVLAVLNLDMVGGGNNLYYIAREGIISRKETSPSLNAIIRSIAPTIIPYWNTLRSGDYAPFLSAGVQCASLQTGGGDDGVDLVYHTQLDRYSRVNPMTVQMVFEVCQRFLDHFEADLSSNTPQSGL